MINYVYYFFNTILSASVPLFFFANGYLLFKKDIDLKRHFKKILKLVILIICWSTITLGILMLFYHQSFTPKEFIQIIYQRKVGYTNHLWYLGTLISVYLLFPILKNAYDTNKKVFLYFTAVAFIFIFGNSILSEANNIYKIAIKGQGVAILETTNYFDIYNPFRMYYGYSIVYFCLGGVMLLYQDKVSRIVKTKRNIMAVIAIILSCLCLFSIGLLYSSTMNANTYDVVFPGFETIFALINVIGIYLLCLNYKSNNKLISLISRNTLGIYLIHMIVFHLTFPIVKQLSFLHNLLGSLIYASIIIIISLGATFLIKKIPIIKKILL